MAPGTLVSAGTSRVGEKFSAVPLDPSRGHARLTSNLPDLEEAQEKEDPFPKLARKGPLNVKTPQTRIWGTIS